MGDQSKSSTWVSVLAMILSLISATGVAYLSYQSNKLQAELKAASDQEHAAIKREEIAFQQTKFDAEQKKVFQEIVSEIIPQLLSDQETKEYRIGISRLFVLYPNQAQEVISSIKSSLTDKDSQILILAQKQAEKLDLMIGEWIVVYGGHRALDAAKEHLEPAIKEYSSANIYLRNRSFRTVIGPFPTQTDAERANISIRAKYRDDAYVVNLKRWCPNPDEKTDHIECITK